jgi:hypothetical protein
MNIRPMAGAKRLMQVAVAMNPGMNPGILHWDTVPKQALN